MRGRQRLGSAAMAVVLAGLDAAAAGRFAGVVEAPQGELLADRQRVEGEAMLALADAMMAGRPGASSGELTIRWRNAFLKAQQGTFVPFTLLIDARGALPGSALVYVRAVARAPVPPPNAVVRTDRRDPGRLPADPKATPGAGSQPESGYPVDAIFPVDLRPDRAHGASVSRGFSIAPGQYDVYVVVRERPGGLAPGAAVRAGVTVHPLVVPDFRVGELTTSSVILADRLTVLPEPLTADQLVERPYVFGQNEITPAADQQFRRTEELVVVFLVYNPTVTPEKHFDVQVEYHFFQRVAQGRKQDSAPGSHPPLLDGEQYFNHTFPQRFSPDLLGLQFDPDAGHPVLAGQGIPLAGFEPGDYRLAIKVTDRLSGKFVMRDVTFTVS